MSASFQDGPAPFSGVPDPDGNIPASDFIIRCGDGVDLHVHKAIIDFISVLFRNMLADATAPITLQRDGKPVVVMSEPSAVLYRVLCIGYPGRLLEHFSLEAQNLDGVWAVHAAANKYLFTGVQELLEKMLENPALLDAHPHRVFAIARLCKLPALARKAALVTLNAAVCPPRLVFPEMELLTAAAIQELYEFHHTCARAAQDLAEEYLGPQDGVGEREPFTRNATNSEDLIWWMNGRSSIHSTDCGPRDVPVHIGNCDPDWDIAPALWFENHVKAFGEKLRSVPTRRTVDAEACTVAAAERNLIKGCPACTEMADYDLVDFRTLLGPRVEESNNALAGNL
ncbi:hypothetical protein B0H11DRAFT_1956010 [Mycena galericulata]|nr:hypothetical protein B0H11DRAFT_1956010 [Mycena galericulata]